MLKLNNIVLFACNEGGHFSQMLGLYELFANYRSILVTDNTRATKNIQELENIENIEYAMAFSERRAEVSKQRKVKTSRVIYMLSYLKLFRECNRIWKRYRPKVIISTGSNIAFPFAIISRVRGTKFVYIETRAKVYSKTTTGKLIGPIVDKVIVQWPEMLNVYKGKAQYYGTLV